MQTRFVSRDLGKWLLVSVEKHKVQISGPWDEAELETPESSAVAVRSPPPH